MDYLVCRNANLAFFVKGGYKGSQGVTRGYRRIQGITWFFKKTIELGFIGFSAQRVTRSDRGLQGVTGF